MSTGSWFKAHRRQLGAHSLIIVGFALFLALAAEPLFDRLERVPGEAQLHRLALPSETGGIRSNIDRVESHGHTTLDVAGWAFIEGEDSEGGEIFIVLRSERKTYVFDTMAAPRPDVTAHFEELGLNLAYSGFMTLIPARTVASGEYTIGIYIRKGDIEALQYTLHTVEL